MSAGYEYYYNLEQQQRRDIYLERVSIKTREFLNRYNDILDDIKNQELDIYVLYEYNNYKNQLDTAFYYLNSNPEEARNISQAIGKLIGTLPKKAKERRQVYKEQEKQKRIEIEKQEQKLKKEFKDLIEEQLSQLKDPILRDYAYIELMDIVQKYNEIDITMENFEKLKTTMLTQSSRIIEQAQIKADEFNKKYFSKMDKEIEKETLLEQIKEEKENIKKIKIEDSTKLNEIMEKLSIKENDIKNGIIDNSINKELDKISDEILSEEVNEEYRRYTVKSIFEILNKLGFKPTKPKKVGDEVKLYAKRINGNEFEASIKANGTMFSHFNGYDYMACKDDIDNLELELQNCYNIELNKTKTIWENPDRIQKNAKPLSQLQREE